jgi:hypothetical protein
MKRITFEICKKCGAEIIEISHYKKGAPSLPEGGYMAICENGHEVIAKRGYISIYDDDTMEYTLEYEDNP